MTPVSVFFEEAFELRQEGRISKNDAKLREVPRLTGKESDDGRFATSRICKTDKIERLLRAHGPLSGSKLGIYQAFVRKTDFVAHLPHRSFVKNHAAQQ